ncbi:alpha/beta fold hydrolase [Qipengyuania sediminis]|uniref:alpha/beta fold hydrolase n=1 Tax=Qipengyuania sediminis TaxID=1532023 RepID=UPI001F104D5C|nr:alpha/beta fold hydrolase [Qipengyuania sediminis]
MTERPFTHRHWQSADGLTLHFRDYAGGRGGRAPVVCLHGLTRNARDFGALAPHIAANSGRRVLVPEMRGRGRSGYAADPASYTVPTYVADVIALLAQEGIARFVAIGTSMGGLITLGIAAIAPERIVGVALNDIGPVVEPAGLERIRGYVGQGGSYPTWVHAARALAELYGPAHPDYALADWLAMAKRSMVLVSNGRIAFDYDMKIAEPILAGETGADAVDLWPMLRALSGKPAVLVRGALSEILSAETLARMQAELPGARAVTVPATGHAPTLDEAEVRAAIDAMLAEAA